MIMKKCAEKLKRKTKKDRIPRPKIKGRVKLPANRKG